MASCRLRSRIKGIAALLFASYNLRLDVLLKKVVEGFTENSLHGRLAFHGKFASRAITVGRAPKALDRKTQTPRRRAGAGPAQMGTNQCLGLPSRNE